MSNGGELDSVVLVGVAHYPEETQGVIGKTAGIVVGLMLFDDDFLYRTQPVDLVSRASLFVLCRTIANGKLEIDPVLVPGGKRARVIDSMIESTASIVNDVSNPKTPNDSGTTSNPTVEQMVSRL